VSWTHRAPRSHRGHRTRRERAAKPQRRQASGSWRLCGSAASPSPLSVPSSSLKKKKASSPGHLQRWAVEPQTRTELSQLPRRLGRCAQGHETCDVFACRRRRGKPWFTWRMARSPGRGGRPCRPQVSARGEPGSAEARRSPVKPPLSSAQARLSSAEARLSSAEDEVATAPSRRWPEGASPGTLRSEIGATCNASCHLRGPIRASSASCSHVRASKRCQFVTQWMPA
jgi:hypothetical protein